MAHESLLQQLQEVANRMRLLETEKKEAAAKAEALQRENRELISLITLVGAKVDEILKIGLSDDGSQPEAANVIPISVSHEQPTESPSDRKNQPKRLFPNASIPD